MTPTIKHSHWYHETDESIPVMENLKQVVMPYIDLIHDKNTTNKLPPRFKRYADMNPYLSYGHNHQIILDNIEAKQILTIMNMWRMKITTM